MHRKRAYSPKRVRASICAEGTFLIQTGHIVFDCDGTLVATQSSILEALRVLMSEIYEREVTLAEAKKAYDPDMLACVEKLGLDVNDEALLKKLERRWIELCQTVGARGPRLYEEIFELVKTLAALGHGLYVWTARERASTLAMMKRFGLMPFILDMRCMDDTTPKPHPQGIYEMLPGIDKDKVVVIGDSTTDMSGARQFGAFAIGALWGEHIEETTGTQLRAAGADALANTPLECLNLIENHLCGERRNV